MRRIAREFMHDHALRMLPMLMGAAAFTIIAVAAHAG